MTILLISVSAALLGATVAWYEAKPAMTKTRAEFASSVIVPTAALLKENQGIISELQAEPYVEMESAILESYLIKVRRDGVAKHADMKQRLDTLAENNTAIVTLIKAYSPHAKTASFTTEGDKFRNYASAWRDRWNSVMELFMAGGNYATSGVPFPSGFPVAVDDEIAALK